MSTVINDRSLQQAEQHFSSFVESKSFPCVGAKSALNRHRMRFAKCKTLADLPTAPQLISALKAFAKEFKDPGSAPVSFVAMFNEERVDEVMFEKQMWDLLQRMHEHDAAAGSSWDPTVSSDPSEREFSFSIAGRAYFVVGLHPRASRMARRAPFPCLVFNFHDQFEAMKSSGKYQGMQGVIRERDVALQGSVNPVLAKFGESSEARQYSGRATGSDWKCPFHASVEAPDSAHV